MQNDAVLVERRRRVAAASRVQFVQSTPGTVENSKTSPALAVDVDNLHACQQGRRELSRGAPFDYPASRSVGRRRTGRGGEERLALLLADAHERLLAARVHRGDLRANDILAAPRREGQRGSPEADGVIVRVAVRDGDERPVRARREPVRDARRRRRRARGERWESEMRRGAEGDRRSLLAGDEVLRQSHRHRVRGALRDLVHGRRARGRAGLGARSRRRGLCSLNLLRDLAGRRRAREPW
mmetsp:Transcript_5777/g.24482  ORF Transcript_5777/g.24482 Transcript_5777/m.24482 type:complete len:241 (+) Transcript_5777:2229-2951(+)